MQPLRATFCTAFNNEWKQIATWVCVCEVSERVFLTAVFCHSPEVQREGPWCGCSTARRWKQRVGSSSAQQMVGSERTPGVWRDLRRGFSIYWDPSVYFIILQTRCDYEYNVNMPIKTVFFPPSLIYLHGDGNTWESCSTQKPQNTILCPLIAYQCKSSTKNSKLNILSLCVQWQLFISLSPFIPKDLDWDWD